MKPTADPDYLRAMAAALKLSDSGAAAEGAEWLGPFLFVSSDSTDKDWPAGVELGGITLISAPRGTNGVPDADDRAFMEAVRGRVVWVLAEAPDARKGRDPE